MSAASTTAKPGKPGLLPTMETGIPRPHWHPRLTGKWSDPGVPHRGWVCDDVEDLGEPDVVCEMCEVQEIRYVHTMRHPDYPARKECSPDWRFPSIARAKIAAQRGALPENMHHRVLPRPPARSGWTRTAVSDRI